MNEATSKAQAEFSEKINTAAAVCDAKMDIFYRVTADVIRSLEGLDVVVAEIEAAAKAAKESNNRALVAAYDALLEQIAAKHDTLVENFAKAAEESAVAETLAKMAAEAAMPPEPAEKPAKKPKKS
jgi:hypothetical protein